MSSSTATIHVNISLSKKIMSKRTIRHVAQDDKAWESDEEEKALRAKQVAEYEAARKRNHPSHQLIAIS